MAAEAGSTPPDDRADDQALERSHWNAYAARWSLIGAPLRPSPTDIDYLRQSITRLLQLPRDRGRALLLGVTPEIAEVTWQPPLDLYAVDKSAGMVRGVWPGDTDARRAVVGDWLELDEAPFDAVIGDGVFSLFQFPDGYAQLGAALAKATRGGGLLSIRLFCRPVRAETLDDIDAALEARRIGNFNVFKWRLLMALQGDATRGVCLADAYDIFCARFGGVAALAARTGFPEHVVGSIEGYRGVEDRYTFSTEDEVIEVLSQGFEPIETWRPDYELGERCPHLTFRRRA